jgi:hypothetical protein
MRVPGGEQGHWTTAQGAWNAFNGIEGALTDYVVPPKVAAELYRALGDIPGVTVDMNMADPAGWHGPALVLTVTDNPGGPWTEEVFLDPGTYQLTGYSEDFPVQCQCPSPGSGETAILNQALVSGPGVASAPRPGRALQVVPKPFVCETARGKAVSLAFRVSKPV